MTKMVIVKGLRAKKEPIVILPYHEYAIMEAWMLNRAYH